jgi:hypothetical protein
MGMVCTAKDDWQRGKEDSNPRLLVLGDNRFARVVPIAKPNLSCHLDVATPLATPPM